jgi:hypothetical protein
MEEKQQHRRHSLAAPATRCRNPPLVRKLAVAVGTGPGVMKRKKPGESDFDGLSELS